MYEKLKVSDSSKTQKIGNKSRQHLKKLLFRPKEVRKKCLLSCLLNKCKFISYFLRLIFKSFFLLSCHMTSFWQLTILCGIIIADAISFFLSFFIRNRINQTVRKVEPNLELFDKVTVCVGCILIAVIRMANNCQYLCSEAKLLLVIRMTK